MRDNVGSARDVYRCDRSADANKALKEVINTNEITSIVDSSYLGPYLTRHIISGVGAIREKEAVISVVPPKVPTDGPSIIQVVGNSETMRIIRVNKRFTELAIDRAGESNGASNRGIPGDLVIIVYPVGDSPRRSRIIDCCDDLNADGGGSGSSANEGRSEERCQEANKQGVAANQQGVQQNTANLDQHSQELNKVQTRFDNLTEYDVKKDISITFETGKSDLSADAKQQLSDLAKEASGMKGYLLEVKGFASTSGSANVNQQLSEDRAENVVTFLQQQGITIQHIINPGAMGTTSPTASNDTEVGRLQNQRVEVKLLVNRGVGGTK